MKNHVPALREIAMRCVRELSNSKTLGQFRTAQAYTNLFFKKMVDEGTERLVQASFRQLVNVAMRVKSRQWMD